MGNKSGGRVPAEARQTARSAPPTMICVASPATQLRTTLKDVAELKRYRQRACCVSCYSSFLELSHRIVCPGPVMPLVSFGGAFDPDNPSTPFLAVGCLQEPSDLNIYRPSSSPDDGFVNVAIPRWDQERLHSVVREATMRVNRPIRIIRRGVEFMEKGPLQGQHRDEIDRRLRKTALRDPLGSTSNWRALCAIPKKSPDSYICSGAEAICWPPNQAALSRVDDDDTVSPICRDLEDTGTLFVSSDIPQDHTLRIWSSRNGKCVGTLDRLDTHTHVMKWVPEWGELFAGGGYAAGVRHFDLKRLGTTRDTYLEEHSDRNGNLFGLDVDVKSGRFFTVSDRCKVKLWPIRPHRRGSPDVFSISSRCGDLRFDAENSLLLLALHGGAIQTRDIRKTGKIVQTFQVHPKVGAYPNIGAGAHWGMKRVPGADGLWVSVSSGGTIALWNPVEGRVVAQSTAEHQFGSRGGIAIVSEEDASGTGRTPEEEDELLRFVMCLPRGNPVVVRFSCHDELEMSSWVLQ